MSSNREINLDKPSKYVREDNPEHSALAEEIERKHVAITASKHIVLKGHPLVVQPGVFSPEFSLIGDLLVETMDIQSEDVVLDLGTGTGFQAIVASDTDKCSPSTSNQRRPNVLARMWSSITWRKKLRSVMGTYFPWSLPLRPLTCHPIQHPLSTLEAQDSMARGQF